MAFPQPVREECAEACNQAYRGYLIKRDACRDLWHVSKGGHHICSRDRLSDAKADIDMLTGRVTIQEL